MDLWRNALIASKFTGIYDFSYAPYALGDALTWQMNIAVLAHESKCSLVDFLLLIDPRRPYCRYQAFLNPNNQIAAIESFTGNYEVIFVDDGSIDQSLARILSWREKNQKIKLLLKSFEILLLDKGSLLRRFWTAERRGPPFGAILCEN